MHQFEANLERLYGICLNEGMTLCSLSKGSTTVTNTMTTTRFYAEKSWLGEEAADSVTLELQYQNEAGSWVSIGSFLTL